MTPYNCEKFSILLKIYILNERGNVGVIPVDVRLRENLSRVSPIFR